MLAEHTTGAASAAPVTQLNLPPHSLLLAYHGTDGGRRAVDLALTLAAAKVTHIVHLLVVPDFWDGMQGDDWLNNSSTRDTFARHLENMLDQDTRELIQEMQSTCSERGLTCEAMLRYGDPADCLLEAVAKQAVDLVVIGPPRPKGTQGLRSRMNMDKLARGLNVPLLVAAGP
ncbi:MAG: hypothetical protein BWK76_03185 [Desulfobulbaceae bacterium A2]|nr:MAG: hypothetical protein BWK76_03185 [Desulfobulbaceae bacterium A2]